MSRHMWLLVEWVDERNIIPSYGVVSSSSLVTEDHDLYPGKTIFVTSKHGNSARRAQILRISDDKRQVKEHKMILERQDHQVKNMLTLCMQTIKELKTDPLLYASRNTSQTSNGASSSGTAPPVTNNDESDSDSDSDNITNSSHSTQATGHVSKPLTQSKNKNQFTKGQNSAIPNTYQLPKHHLVNNSTPLPLKACNGIRSTPKQTTDQSTQTDDPNTVQVPVEKIDQMENVLTRLFNQFLHLVSGLQIDYPDEHNDIRAGSNYNGTDNGIPEHGGQIVEEEQAVVNEPAETYQVDNSHMEAQDLSFGKKAKSLKIRRVSAHTTNNIEPGFSADGQFLDRRNDMVPIGSGRAKVPVRLLNEIDWNSYSTATRQLLQAIFPRKVLATSSLTGKKSPAFANIPAKKCLDPDLINDIVDTVSERCAVPKRSVRNCITIKCTDEAKLYRSRMQNKNRPMNLVVNTKQENQENVPPSPMSHASSNGMD